MKRSPYRSKTSHRTVRVLRSRNGAAIVELAIVLPLLLLLLVGTIEACAMIHLQQSLEITAYEAARTSLIPQSTTKLVEDTANEFLAKRNTQGGSITISPSNFEAAAIGTTITIKVSAPANRNLPLPPFFFANQTLTGSCSMMKEYQ